MTEPTAKFCPKNIICISWKELYLEFGISNINSGITIPKTKLLKKSC